MRDALTSTPWSDPPLVASDVTVALFEKGWLRPPDGWEEPSDEQLQKEAESALEEWRRST